MGLPVDYFAAYAVSGLATELVWRPGLEQWAARAGVVLALSILSVPLAAVLRASSTR
jgi:hypothetical protein